MNVNKRMNIDFEFEMQQLRQRAVALSDSAHKQLLHKKRQNGNGIGNGAAGMAAGASPIPPNPDTIRRINNTAQYFVCPNDLPGLNLFKARYDDAFVYTSCLWVIQAEDRPLVCNYDAITGDFRDSFTPDIQNLCLQQLP